MTEQLIECVPNFSEGRDLFIIRQITDEIEKVDNVRLLDVDPGADMNRTVVTFVGDRNGVKKAAFNAIKKASELIDMTKHAGSHPRMGATDVCPFVPVSGISIDECIQLSREVAKEVGDKLNIPVYLYEKSAQIPERENLAVIRQGEYEALEAKLTKPEWKPDFGPSKFNSRSGATVIGVREFLIAYNINLNSRDKLHAIDIAYELREKGRSVRRPISKPYYYKSDNVLKYSEGLYPCGECEFVGESIFKTIDHCKTEHAYDLVELLLLNGIDHEKPEGESVKKKGLFKNCKAIGWMVDEYDRAQISINLTDYKVTSMHDVLDKTRQLAAERGLVVTGSEIVGMVPYPALLKTGKHYLKKQGRSRGIPIKDILQTAIQSLGLNDVSDFNIQERILGLPKNMEKALVELKLTEFVDEVSRESPAPGGGSIAALSGALGASLSSMVSNLTANKRGSSGVDEILNEAAENCQEIKNILVKAIDSDTDAFNEYMAARRLPNRTKEERESREIAMQKGLQNAILVPLRTAEESFRALELAEIVIKNGNPNSITDVAVGAQMSYSGVLGGVYNVLINLKDVKDISFCQEMNERCRILRKKAFDILLQIINYADERII